MTSPTWAGYAATGAAGTFTSVAANWIVPPVACNGAATRTQAKASDGSAHAAELAATYGFIYDVLPATGRISVRRARATIARASDAEAHRGW